MRDKLTTWLEELRDKSPSIKDETNPASNTKDIFLMLRHGKLIKQTYKFENTTFILKPYWEQFDFMVRMRKFQLSNKLDFGEVKRPGGMRSTQRPIAYRLRPESKTKKLLGDFF